MTYGNLTMNSKKEKRKYFTINRVTYKNEDKELVDSKLTLKITSDDLCYFLRHVSNESVFYDSNVTVDSTVILDCYYELKTMYAGNDVVDELIEFIEKEYKEHFDKLKRLENDGMATFESLRYVLSEGKKIFTKDDEGHIIAGMVKHVSYKRTMFGSYIDINVDTIDTDGSSYMIKAVVWKIGEFNGTIKINDLSVRILDEHTESQLIKRGNLFNKIGRTPSYMQYSGTLYWKAWQGTIEYKASGRVMIDPHNFSKSNPGYSNDYYDDETSDFMESIPEDKLYMVPSTIKGFSFNTKKWGELSLDKLSDIEFASDAFDTLVMDEDRKKLVSALVRNTDKSFTDIINGKGGGCIFLLHGPPGVGKTLTAESIAEVLERPLYSVSVGELGVEPDQLEERLRQILEIATEWDAVILIDEADIFLEARDERDIARNAMVGIFLRLLEYHQGVMFLTTNRVNTFDEAFYSRISVSLTYDELSDDAREQIWTNLLKAANVQNIDASKLRTYKLNGRQIKNVIRLSQSLAVDTGNDVTLEQIINTIQITGQFEQDHMKKTSNNLTIEPIDEISSQRDNQTAA